MAASPIPQAWPFEVTAGRFRIHSDFDLQPQQNLVDELSRLAADVSQLLAVPAQGNMLHVVLFERQTDYRRYLGHYFPTVPDRRALYIQDRGAGMLFAHHHADLAVDLRHESAHALLNDNAKPLPLWLDEGLAEYFEVAAAERMRGHAHLEPTIKGLQNSDPPDMERLESLNDVAGMNIEDYRQAWSWVHFLLHRNPETRTNLVKHVADARAGRTSEPLSRVLARSYPEWKSSFRDHFLKLAVT
ncbi:MAG: DUF1570 domain-containing protein [Pirellulales bacterium]